MIITKILPAAIIAAAATHASSSTAAGLHGVVRDADTREPIP